MVVEQRASVECKLMNTMNTSKANETPIINQINMKKKSITITLALCAAAAMLAPNVMAAEKDTLNATDVSFVKHAAASGMAEAKVAELGVKKASRADVKEFAEVLVKDHTLANEELKKLASTKGVELSAVIEPKHAGSFQKLEKVSGTEFDKEFLADQVSDHKKCVSNFETASNDVTDTEVKLFAVKMLPTLKAHLEKAKELAAK